MARILIVDDALMMRKTIGNMLTKAGHVIVDEAINGEQAVHAYQRHRPDLVTMDITMPGVDGISALAQIIAIDPEAKVIMVSALGQKHKVFDALQAGAKSYILKPFKEDKLLSVIHEVLQDCTIPVTEEETVSKLTAPETGYCNNTGILAKPFMFENRDNNIHITILKDFAGCDFSELISLIADKSESQPRYVNFNFTCCNALNGSSAPSFADVMASVLAAGSALKIICYTRDYTMFFRNEACLKGAEFELVKKQGIL